MEQILQDWEDFAREIWPGDQPSVRILRDHAEEMLEAVVTDMQTLQSVSEQKEKSVGNRAHSHGS